MNFVLLYLLLILSSSAFAMPPEPGAWNQIDVDSRNRIDSLVSNAIERGLNSSSAITAMAYRERLLRDDGAEIVLRLPVILIEFADNAANGDLHPRSHYEDLLFSVDEVETGSVREFYFENSFEQVVIAGVVAGWYRAPQNYAYYTNRQYGLGNYPRNSQRLAEDAIRAANGDTDFSQFDNNDDGVVDAPFIIHAGGGAEQNPNNVDLIWSHAWNVEALGAMDGVQFEGYTIVPEDGKIGVFSHELGHALFGLPDLYDTNGESAGLGYWSVMSYGAWGLGGQRPVQFDSWCKARLGWIEPEMLDWDREAVLPPAESSGRSFILWDPNSRGDEYFLAEYRDGSGFDGELPGPGLLIYHVDQSMSNNDHPFFPGNEGELHDLIALEQADFDFDLERFNNTGDDGDPFPGRSENTSYESDTEPGSRDYDGQATGVAVRNISIVEDGVSADWIVGVDGPPLVEQRVSLNAGWNLISLRVTPENLNIVEMFAPLVERELLRFVKDGSGRFYAPSRQFNNIPVWDVKQAYFVNVTENTELVAMGEEIEFNREIPLHIGWQTVAYFPAGRMSVQHAYNGIVNNLSIAKDDVGRFYLPRNNFSNMENLRPGKGYLIRMTADQIHQYPEE